MHVDIVPNRKSRPAVLLRESYREGNSVKKRTIANITDWPPEKVAALQRLLKGEQLVGINDVFQTVSSRQHGNVSAVLSAMERLGFANLIASRPSKERTLVLAMVAWRILHPMSKLATQRAWHLTTLPKELGIEEANEDDLYAAMDWLADRQIEVEKKLAKRHLQEGGLVLYDLSSSYFEGTKCKLAKFGYNRDKVKGRQQVNYGMIADSRGCPVAVSVFAGNVSDTKTLMPSCKRGYVEKI